MAFLVSLSLSALEYLKLCSEHLRQSIERSIQIEEMKSKTYVLLGMKITVKMTLYNVSMYPMHIMIKYVRSTGS